MTVIFVPDLSECLPSLDSWRDQWLAHKKAVAERERQLSLKKEVCCFYCSSPGFCMVLFWVDFYFNHRHALLMGM